MNRFLGFVFMALIATSASAESVDSYLQKQKVIDQKDQTRQELELDLRIAELKNKIDNVGKEDTNDKEAGQPGAQGFNNQGYFQRELKPEEPTYEDRVEAQKNTILDGMRISSVYPSKKDGALTAVLAPSGGGQAMSVSVGDVVGNWKVIAVALDTVKARHLDSEDIRIIQYSAH